MSRRRFERVLVTGGAGFIGAALVRKLLAAGKGVLVLDKLTYAADLRFADELRTRDPGLLAEIDICDAAALAGSLHAFAPDLIFNLAAESHVDRSIASPDAFIETNVRGAYTLLQEALRLFETYGPEARASFLLVHVSTDEVFGSLGPHGAFREDSPYRPSSPYSASKAAADHLVEAWRRTYGLPTAVTRCSNNFGPGQSTDKFIPVVVTRALCGSPVPVYGRGANVRDWIYVDDHADALLAVAEKAAAGASYNIGARQEAANIDLARMVCRLLDELAPQSPHRPHERLIRFVGDRPGHDARYAVDPGRIERELGWRARVGLEQGLAATVSWYIAERRRWEPGLASLRPARAACGREERTPADHER